MEEFIPSLLEMAWLLSRLNKANIACRIFVPVEGNMPRCIYLSKETLLPHTAHDSLHSTLDRQFSSLSFDRT